MAAFLIILQIGSTWPALYVLSYIARVIVAAVLLIWLREKYTKISWRFAWLGAIVGVIGVVQWVGMQLWLQRHVAWFTPDPNESPFNPWQAINSQPAAVAFIAFRWIAGATIVVPVMEELFWRDFLWRNIIAPSDFKLAHVGEWSVQAFFAIAIVFSTVHGHWWLTAIVWALMIGGLLVYTKSLGACIVAHAVTNLLLGAYVLIYKDWSFW